MKPVTRAEISARVAKRTDQGTGVIDAVFAECIKEMKAQLRQGREVTLSGFGRLYPCWEAKAVELFVDDEFAEELSKPVPKEL